MSDTNDPATAAMKAAMEAKIAHMQAVLSGSYKPEETTKKMETLTTKIRELNLELLGEKVTLFKHHRLSDEPAPELDQKIGDDELHAVLEKALVAFSQGANGQQLADFIGDYRITSKRISEYQSETFRLVRSDSGLNTKFRLATADETKRMREEALAQAAAAKAAEEAIEAAANAAAVRKTKTKGKAKGK